VANVVVWDNFNKKYAHAGITIRESGCLDFYYNYRLVEETKASFKDTVKGYNEERYLEACKHKTGNFIDVNADFGCLYFRDGRDIYRCPISWK
jgi:hypothetical protein